MHYGRSTTGLSTLIDDTSESLRALDCADLDVRLDRPQVKGSRAIVSDRVTGNVWQGELLNLWT